MPKMNDEQKAIKRYAQTHNLPAKAVRVNTMLHRAAMLSYAVYLHTMTLVEARRQFTDMYPDTRADGPHHVHNYIYSAAQWYNDTDVHVGFAELKYDSKMRRDAAVEYLSDRFWYDAKRGWTVIAPQNSFSIRLTSNYFEIGRSQAKMLMEATDAYEVTTGW